MKDFDLDDYSEEQLGMDYEDWEAEDEFAKELMLGMEINNRVAKKADALLDELNTFVKEMDIEVKLENKDNSSFLKYCKLEGNEDD